jgi:hypothetical protein
MIVYYQLTIKDKSMNSNLQKAERIIKQDTNGSDLTVENYLLVESLLTSEIRLLTRTLTGKPEETGP